MRALLIPALVILLGCSPASAHCFSQWRYPYPQKCHQVSQVEQAPAALPKKSPRFDWRPPADVPDIPVVLPPVAPEEDDAREAVARAGAEAEQATRDGALAALRNNLAKLH